jgi:hypothetical protein
LYPIGKYWEVYVILFSAPDLIYDSVLNSYQGLCKILAWNIDTSRSTSGIVFTFGGGVIAWRSKRQRLVALSSTKVEYVATTLTTKEGLLIKTILEEFDVTDIS